MTAPPSLVIKQAAVQLGVSRRTIYTFISQGFLQTIRVSGGSQRVLISSLRSFQMHYRRHRRMATLN